MTEEAKGAAVCADPYCKQLDILPFLCHYCKKSFCLEHFRPLDHHCPLAGSDDRRIFTCPICLKSVPLVYNEPPDITWERHNRADCKPCEHRQGQVKPRCPVKGCRETLTPIVAFECKKCHQTVCLKHRFEDTHNCGSVQVERRLPSYSRDQSSRWFSSQSVWGSITRPIRQVGKHFQRGRSSSTS